MGPINYGALQAQLNLTPLQQGLDMRRSNRLQDAAARQRETIAQLAREKFEYDQQKDTNYLRDVEAWKVSGGQPDGLRDLAMRYPEQSERLLKAGDSYDARQKNDMITTGFTTLGALASGNTELAIKNLSDRVEALDRARIDSSHTRNALDMIRKGDVNGAKTYIGYAMSGLVGADHTANVMENIGIGAKADATQRDDARADAELDETRRHNRAMEGQGAARVQLSREAGARAGKKGGGKTGGSKLPSGFIPD